MNYNLEALKICIKKAQEAIKEVTVRPEETWLLFEVHQVEIYQTGIYLRGKYKRESEERLLKRVQWNPKMEPADRMILEFLEEHHPKGLIMPPSEVLNCIL